MEEYCNNKSPLRERPPRRHSISSSDSDSGKRFAHKRGRKSSFYRRSRSRGHGRSRSRSRSRRFFRKRHRSPSRRSSSSSGDSESSSSSSASSSRKRGNAERSRSRRRRRSRSRRWRRGGAAALLSSEPFSLRGGGGGFFDKPVSDWVCGVCSNPNSAKRDECFRCGTRFAVAINATPCEEIRILKVPQEVTVDDIVATLAARFAEHGDSCRVVAYGTDGGTSDNEERAVHLRFESVVEATMALTYARSMLLIGQSLCSMEFSSVRRAKTSLSSPSAGDGSKVGESCGGGGCGGAEAVKAAKFLDGLPSHLQPGVWKPVEHFSSAEEEKEYLDVLSKHWDKLSEEQKNYYDECVCRALAAQCQKQQAKQKKNLSTAVKEISSGHESSATTTTTTAAAASSGAVSSLDSIKKRLMEKKQAVKSAAKAQPPTESNTTSAALLKERLAMKKVQLSLAAKSSNVTETETVATSLAPALSSSHKEGTKSSQVLFYGFPIPSHFPTKTDYLTNTKSPLFRSSLIFRYVPPAVAERIVPPCDRLSTDTKYRRNTYHN